MTTDVMIDLETLGLRKNAVVLSIGAVEFCLTDAPGAMRRKFHHGVYIDDQVERGRVIDQSVFVWWLQQSAVARNAIVQQIAAGLTLPSALRNFTVWLDAITGSCRDKLRLWCKGADNDIAWLSSAFDDCGMVRPFPYNQVRDMRAYTELMIPGDWVIDPAAGAHDALSDAVAQAAAVQAFWQRMKFPAI